MNVVTTLTRRRVDRQVDIPGSMTAVMRSLSVTAGPKVLRVGLVLGGRVVEDRIVKDRRTVTVGASEDASFVIAAPGVPPTFKLFERVGDAYYLNVTAEMTGRVALDVGLVDVTTLRGAASGEIDGRRARVRLSEDARGKVVLGDASFLFQFVACPVTSSRPQLPVSVKEGFTSQIDWNLTILAAFSFLLHFGVVGWMCSDWADPLVDTGATVGGILDLAPRVPVAPLEVPLHPDPLPTTDSASNPEPSARPTTVTPPHGDGPPKAPKPLNDADIAALSAAATSIGVASLVALRAPGTALQAALADSNTPPVDLGPTTASAVGAHASAGNELNFGLGTRTVLPGATAATLRAIGVRTAGPGSSVPSKETEIAGPRMMTVEALDYAGAQAAPGAAQVVAGLRASFRRCYNAGLGVDPAMSGKVTLSVHIATNGEVSSADSSGNTGLSDTVVQCLVTRLRTAQFDPGPAASTLRIPVTFVQQAR